MHLSLHSLRPLDTAHLDALDEAALRVLSVKRLEDLKEARDRLNQGPENSSRPPSRRALWERKGGGRAPDEDPEGGDCEPEAAVYAAREGPPPEPTGALDSPSPPYSSRESERLHANDHGTNIPFKCCAERFLSWPS